MSTIANRPDLSAEEEKDPLAFNPEEAQNLELAASLDTAKTLQLYTAQLLDQTGGLQMDLLRGPYSYYGDLPKLDAPRLPEAPAPAEKKSNVTVGADGVVTIDYPKVDGQPKKDRTMKPDGAGGFSEIITKTEGEGTSRLTQRDGKWFMSFQGIEFPMKGVKIDPNTHEVSIEVQPGQWNREKTDGTVQSVKANADGSLVSLDAAGGAQKITRPDNSSVEKRDEQTIVETAVGGKQTTWKKQGSEWVSGDGQKRTEFTLDKSGLMSYKSAADSFTYKVAGDGSQIVEGEGKAKITLDAQNRVQSIEWADRKERRDFKYFGDSKDIQEVKKTDLATGTTYTNTRDDASALRWHVKTNNGSHVQDWDGKVQMGPGGVYSRLMTDSQGNANGKKWLSWATDGTETHDLIDAQGTRTAHDAQGKILFKEATNGSRSAYDAAGALTQIKTADKTTFDISADKIKMVDGVTGETINFTKNGDAWTSDSKRFAGTRKNLSVNEQGELAYTNDKGQAVTERRDNTRSVSQTDGSRFEYNAKGDLTSIVAGGTTRKFDIEGGQLKITDTRDGQPGKVVFDTRTANAKDVRINRETGDVSFATDKGATILRGNGLTIELDKQGNQTKVTRADGSSREFAYVQQKDAADKEVTTLAKIVDRDKKGAVTEEWTALSDGGKVTSTFENKPTKEGQKPKQRDNIEIARDGDYKWKKPGDATEHVARVGSRDGAEAGMSADIDEAREQLTEVLRDKLDESQQKRFAAMMKQFETRMADRLDARMAAGITAPDQIRKEVEQAIRGTYDNLAKMVSTPSDAAKPTFMDQKTRVRLAENFMLHAMDPMTSDQGPSGPGEEGGHGTCWIQGGHIWGMVQHPDAMADLLKQVSLDGQYTTKNGGDDGDAPKTISFSKAMLEIKGDTQEARWTVDRAMKEWEETPNYRRQILGDRSPVGFIFDNVLPVIGGRPPGQIDGGHFESINQIIGARRADGTFPTKHVVGSSVIMKMVTGDTPADIATWTAPPGQNMAPPKNHLLDVSKATGQDALNENYRRTLLEKGSVMSHTMNHTTSRHIIKVNGEWMHVQDDQHNEKSDYIIGMVPDLAAYAKGGADAVKNLSERVAVPRVAIPGVTNDVAGPVNPTLLRPGQGGVNPKPDVPLNVVPTGGDCPGPGPCPSPNPGRVRPDGTIESGDNPYQPRIENGGCRPCQPSWQPCRPVRRGLFGGGGLFGRRCR